MFVGGVLGVQNFPKNRNLSAYFTCLGDPLVRSLTFLLSPVMLSLMYSFFRTVQRYLKKNQRDAFSVYNKLTNQREKKFFNKKIQSRARKRVKFCVSKKKCLQVFSVPVKMNAKMIAGGLFTKRFLFSFVCSYSLKHSHTQKNTIRFYKNLVFRFFFSFESTVCARETSSSRKDSGLDFSLSIVFVFFFRF